MKKTKIIIPALGMLLLSTAASVSGTVAWFSMNNSVTVTGMTVTTKVSSNLQISAVNVEANYGDELQQERSGIIEPASTVDGAAFYYTTSASGDGVAKENTDADEAHKTFKQYGESANPAIANAYAGKANYDAAFNSAYGFANPSVRASQNENDNMCYAYIDYSFYVKGTYASASDLIVLDYCDLAYKNAEGDDYGPITTAWAWRVGMFVAKANEGQEIADSTAAVSNNLVTILDFEDKSLNQNEIEIVTLSAGDTIAANTLHKKSDLSDEALTAGTATAEQAGKYYKASSENGTPKAVNGQTKTSRAAIGAKANAQAKVDANPTALTTQRYKIVIRLWLEGEDVSCTSTTFANLTRNWKLDLRFRQGSAETPVQYISTNATPAA